PARALRALGGRDRGDPARRRGAASARTRLRAMSRRTLLLVAGAGAAAGIALRVWAVLLPQGSLDADEAVVGLLTHKILHGTLPVFFPGQGYGGTQEPFLAVPFVAAFGLETWTIRIVVVLLWAASAVLVWRIGLRVLDERRAVLAAVL